MRNLSKYRFIALGFLAGTAIIATGCGSSSSSTASPLAVGGLILSSNTTTVGFDGSVQFSATGGTPPYRYSVVSPAYPYSGTISSSTGYYVAPAANETIEVEVTDATGAVATESITVSSSGTSGSDTICSDYTNCQNLLALSVPIDGSYFYGVGATNANAACMILNHGSMVSFQSQNISISCGNMYTIAEWNGQAFQSRDEQLCSQGYATVLSQITCSQ